MYDKNDEQVLKARKRALQHAIREERIRLNAIEKERNRRERIRKLQEETEELERQARNLDIVPSQV
jgi:hypothetical protein